MKTVTAAIIEAEGRLLVVRRALGQKLAGLWEFPGGKVEEGESLQACLERELQEELGVRCRVGAPVAESQYDYEHGSIRLVALRAEVLDGTLKLSVHDALSWLAPSDLETVDLAPADVPIARRLKEMYA